MIMRDRIVAVLLFLLAFTATAYAAGAPFDPDQSLVDLARPVFDAVMNGQGWLAAFLALIPLTAAAYRYLPDRFGGTWLRGNAFGKMIAAFVLSFAGAGATALAAGAAMSGGVALTATKVALLALGGWKLLHELAKSATASEWFQTKAPGWLKAIAAMALALIGSNAIAKAEAAGKAAEIATPAPGVAATTGAGETL